MKKFLMTAVLGMFALAGFSQVKWDAKVGMNFSNVTKYDDAKALPGFQLGVGMDYGFSESWSLQSGLLISSKGYKIEDVKVRPIYLDIPILAAYKFNISDNTKFVINAGPYLAFGLGGKAKDDNFDLTYIIHSGFISGYQNRYGDNLKPPTNVYHRMTA